MKIHVWGSANKPCDKAEPIYNFSFFLTVRGLTCKAIVLLPSWRFHAKSTEYFILFSHFGHFTQNLAYNLTALEG